MIKEVLLQVEVTRKVKAKLTEIAKANDLNRSQFVRRLITKAIEEYELDQDAGYVWEQEQEGGNGSKPANQ